MRDLDEVRQRFEAALDALVDKLQQDRTVVAAVLFGSLAHDVVWERSDIDMVIVRDDQKARKGAGGAALTSHGVNVHAIVTTRGEFRRTLQRSIAGGLMHSATSLGRILFTRDESLRRIFEEVHALGEHDRRLRLLESGAMLAITLDKAEKWLRVKQDPHYSAMWVTYALLRVGEIEVLLHKQVPGREAVLQALELNPEVVGPLARDFMDAPKTLASVQDALRRMNGYLEDRVDDVFGPLLDHLADERTVLSVSDLEQHFEGRLDVRAVTMACEWLADRGVVTKASAPYHLTQHSRVELDQLAFFVERR